MKTLYISDLDGTLLNTKDKINPQSLEIINALVEKGVLFTYATARSLVSAAKVTEGLKLKMPVIVYNGVSIIDPNTGELYSHMGFSEEEIVKVVKVLEEHDISPLVYSYVDGIEKVSWLPSRENEGVKRYLSLRQGDKRFRALEDASRLYEGQVFYFTCIGEKEQLQPIYDIFASDKRYRCTLQQELYRTEYWCEIMPAAATKALAIQKLKEMQNFDRVVCFGDAINDIPMFQLADEAYAVENAVEELKALATGIVASNDEDGVAKWLLEHVTAYPLNVR